MLGYSTTAQRFGKHTVEPAGAVSHGTHCKGKTGVRDGPPQPFSSLGYLVAMPAIGCLCRSPFLSLRQNKKDAEIGLVLSSLMFCLSSGAAACKQSGLRHHAAVF